VSHLELYLQSNLWSPKIPL